MSITDVPSLSGPVAKPLWTPVTARIRNDSPPPPSPLAHRPTPASIAQKTPSCHKQLEIYRVHSGLGTPPLFRPPLWRSAVVSGLRRCFEQAFGSRRGSGSGTRSNSRGRGARHQGREGQCGAEAREGGAAPGPGRPSEKSAVRPRGSEAPHQRRARVGGGKRASGAWSEKRRSGASGVVEQVGPALEAGV